MTRDIIRMRRKTIKGVFLVLMAVASLNAVVLNCVAGQFYPDGYARCLSTSGGRSHIWSVANYACEKAVAKSQNACASWVGPANDSRSTGIAASALTGTVPIKIWGMCTDRANTSSRMEFIDDGGSISCGGSCNFTRSGNWGSPSSKDATLDIAKFIRGAMLTTFNGQAAYYRMVIVDRMHGGNTSQGVDFSPIYLVVGGAAPVVQPEVPANICNSWAQSTYGSSNEREGTTSIDIRIKNLNPRFVGSPEGDWGDSTIYAMPTDDIAWHACYFPGVQTTAFTEVSSVNGANWGNYEELPDNYCRALYTTNYYSVTYKKLKDAAAVWENKYSLFGKDDGGATYGNLVGGGSGVAGDTAVLFADNGRLTNVDNVGNTFTEAASTWRPIKAIIYPPRNRTVSVNKCPCCPDPPEKDEEGNDVPCDETNDCWCCNNTYSTDLADAYVNYASTGDQVSVKIPYNYHNYTGVITTSDVIYAGETVKLRNVWAQVSPRSNGVTRASYATKVKNAQLRLIAYVSNSDSGQRGSFMSSSGNACSVAGAGSKQCIELEHKSGFTLNPSGKLDGDTTKYWEGKTYNSFDASAGDYVCFVSAVYPATVSGDTDMGTNGNGQWRYSDPDCTVIAKKPTFQVWGGGMYSNGSVKADYGRKRNIYNNYYNSWNNLFKNGGFKKTGGTIIQFNPWVEEALIFNTGVTSDLASGAASAKSNESGNPAKVGITGDFCSNLIPLTFANYGGGLCGLGGSVAGNSGLNNGISDREQLIRYWANANNYREPCGSMWGGTCNYIESASGETIQYIEGGNMSVSGTISRGNTRLVKASGIVTITDNLRYDTGNYGSLRDIPKVIIYAQNINVACNVDEVDAILITRSGGNLDTCSDVGSDINEQKRSRQLKVFGMAITDSVDLKRTYGAAANSNGNRTDAGGIPSDGAAAEVFDFDSSILMWSEFMAGSAETDTLQTVYQREIAPRW